jgi:hypothetical protein
VQKIPALLKVRHSKNEKNTQRSGNELVAIVRKPAKVCALLASNEERNMLYNIVDYEKRGQAKHTFNT